MIRLIIREDACTGDGTGVAPGYRTFDVSAPELEEFLARERCFASARVVGAELLPEESK